MLTFREVEIEDAELILSWRTKERVTRFMSTDISHDVEAQKLWLSSSYSKPSYYHWIIQHNGKDIGFLNIVDWNRQLKETYWGYYVGEDGALGIGSIVPPCLYRFAFDILGVECVKAAIFKENAKVIQLHRLQGYEPEPSGDHIIHKNGNAIPMVCMTLHKTTFAKKGYSRLDVELPVTRWRALEVCTGE